MGGRRPRLQRKAPLLAFSEGSKHLGRHAQAELGIQALVLRHLRLKENPHNPPSTQPSARAPGDARLGERGALLGVQYMWQLSWGPPARQGSSEASGPRDLPERHTGPLSAWGRAPPWADGASRGSRVTPPHLSEWDPRPPSFESPFPHLLKDEAQAPVSHVALRCHCPRGSQDILHDSYHGNSSHCEGTDCRTEGACAGRAGEGSVTCEDRVTWAQVSRWAGAPIPQPGSLLPVSGLLRAPRALPSGTSVGKQSLL